MDERRRVVLTSPNATHVKINGVAATKRPITRASPRVRPKVNDVMSDENMTTCCAIRCYQMQSDASTGATRSKQEHGHLLCGVIG